MQVASVEPSRVAKDVRASTDGRRLLEGFMFHPGFVARLAEQLVSVNARMSEEGRGPVDVASCLAIARSLRQTLACIVQRRNPHDVGAQGFLLLTDGEGNPTVRFRSQVLPVSAGFIRQLWRAAGTELVPGQAILLDPVIAREIAEEALAQNSVEDLRLKDEKLKLVAACLQADPSGQGSSRSPVKPGCCRSGAA